MASPNPQLLETTYHNLLENLYKKYQRMLAAFAYQYVRSPEDAREIVQEVFISVWNNRENLQLDGNLKSYLYTATKNKCLNFLDKRRLKTVSLESNPNNDRPDIQVSDGNLDQDETMQLAELKSVIFDEVQKLPPKCRQIFILSRQEQLSYKEIAAKLNISTKTIENQIGIAIKRIRKRVAAYQNPVDKRGSSLLPMVQILTIIELAFGG